VKFLGSILALLIALPVLGQHEHHGAAPEEPEEKPLQLSIPDVPLVDQEGRPVRFHTDLIKGKVVAVNFIFTTCTTVCPPMGATFGKLREQLGERAGKDVHLISVSVDPRTDTPERLKAWAAKFGSGPGWTLVTGDPEQVRKLLDAFGVFTANPAEHTPLVFVGNDARGEWTRAYGLAPPAKLAELLDHAGRNPAAAYFGDIPLVDQDGKTLRLYSDLIQGRTVVIDVMFTGCTGACPVMSRTLAKVQDWLGDRLGKDVYLISLSVDPVNDTPAKLKEYAAGFKAKPGWFFLTGKPEDVRAALGKLGQAVEAPEAHQSVFLIGNDRTGLWKKALGLAAPEEILPIVDSVVNDRG
jgi:cytochrome oxidase Cu insertion factor (SCO1/SenC/PrrC family)